MRIYYDFHIHSALSACGDEDMSPNNILNMAMLKELDAIAITDHNSIYNAEVCVRLAKEKDILVVPGMEIETKEEIHVIALFKSIDDGYKMQDRFKIEKIKINEKIFGRQIVFDENDEEKSQIPYLLSTSCGLSIDETIQYINELNGMAFLAHVDKLAYSCISVLGFIPEDLNVSGIEFSARCDKGIFLSKNKYLKKYKYLINSDAHFLWDISEKNNYVDIQKKDIESIFEYFKA